MRQADQNRKARERPRTQHPWRNLYFLLWLRIPREALTYPTGCRAGLRWPTVLIHSLFLATYFFWLRALHRSRRGTGRRNRQSSRIGQRGFRRRGELVSMLQELRYLPHLRGCKHLLEAGHSSQANPIFHLPVDLARRIVGDHVVARE